MAKTSTKKTKKPVGGRAKTSGSRGNPPKPGVLERQIVIAAQTLGTLVGQAESRWEGWRDQRAQVAAALTTVRDRATAVLSELGSEVRSIAGRAGRVGTAASTRAAKARKTAKAPRSAKTTRARRAPKDQG